jgi:hypothetical protein
MGKAGKTMLSSRWPRCSQIVRLANNEANPSDSKSPASRTFQEAVYFPGCGNFLRQRQKAKS